MDSGYEGDAPTKYPKISLHKPSTVPLEEQPEQQQLAHIRVVVEQFFGRLKKLWLITTRPYPLHHDSFDADIDNCILLTNEHIALALLSNNDREFLWRWRRFTSEEAEEKKRKRTAQVAQYNARKRQRNEANFVY
eukprot:TRINITY_DN2702_c0_g1_i2.p1 TRINITY_DN2702_c0_g1~~TRINITY_DN2702_c0_g1_i2.p1  ORF type:complete len:135 (+),score=32.88 TRINITY_DN2702_c0_g1_i2:109-513(+)